MEHKRRVPRRKGVLGWVGKYRIDQGPQSLWCECEVIDISSDGVGIEVSPSGAIGADLVGRQIAVEVNTPIGAAVSVQLVGQIRNVVPNWEGKTRVGIEFVGLSDPERAILGAIASILPVAW